MLTNLKEQIDQEEFVQHTEAVDKSPNSRVRTIERPVAEVDHARDKEHGTQHLEAPYCVFTVRARRVVKGKYKKKSQNTAHDDHIVWAP